MAAVQERGNGQATEECRLDVCEANRSAMSFYEALEFVSLKREPRKALGR